MFKYTFCNRKGTPGGQFLIFSMFSQNMYSNWNKYLYWSFLTALVDWTTTFSKKIKFYRNYKFSALVLPITFLCPLFSVFRHFTFLRHRYEIDSSCLSYTINIYIDWNIHSRILNKLEKWTWFGSHELSSF